MFPPEVERDAFRAGNEFGWTRAQIPMVVAVLRSRRMGILGGELWFVRDGVSVWGAIPQRDGPPAVYPWVTNRRLREPWPDFVERDANEALAAVERFPEPGDLPPDLVGQILYNLTWVSEAEFEKLIKKYSIDMSL